jgi:hypothetical protein
MQGPFVRVAVAGLLLQLLPGGSAEGQERMTGYGPEHWSYELAPGVIARTVRWFSDGVGMHAPQAHR